MENDQNNDSLEKRASFWDSKAITHNVIGGALILIGQWLLAGVPTMIAGLIAFAAWFGGLPLYVVLIIGVLVFLVASIALYVVERVRSLREDRKQRQLLDPAPALKDELGQANVEQLTQSEIEKDDARRARATAESERDNLKKERDGPETERNDLSKSLEELESALEAERARNASPRLRTSIKRLRFNHGADTNEGDWYSVVWLEVDVWNDSPKAATIRGYRCKLIMGDQEFEGVSQPLGDDFQASRERIAVHSFARTRTSHTEDHKDLSINDESPITDSTHKAGWLSFSFSKMPFDAKNAEGHARYREANVRREGYVRLSVIDNKGEIHEGEPYPISGNP